MKNADCEKLAWFLRILHVRMRQSGRKGAHQHKIAFRSKGANRHKAQIVQIASKKQKIRVI